MGTRRAAWAAAVLAAWAPCARGDGQADPERYAAILLEGAKAGYALQKRESAGGAVTTTARVRFVIRRGQAELTTESTTLTRETADGAPLWFKETDTVGGQTTVTEGTIDKGVCRYTVTSGASRKSRTMAWPAGALLPEGMRLLARAKGLAAGTTYQARQFSPQLMMATEMTVTVGGAEEVDLLGRVAPATKVTTAMDTGSGRITQVAYVDKEGNELKTVTPMMGLTLETIACDKAYALSADNPLDFLARFALAAPGPLPEKARRQTVVYVLKPKGKAHLDVPADNWQAVEKLADGIVRVTVQPGRAGVGKVPYAGREAAALEALKPSRYVESDDAKIVAAARRAAGKTKDAAEVARKLEAFVASYITKKDLSVGYASAAEVLASRQGDCTEHAVLLAALCRAAGLPAQVVAGIAYVEGWAGQKHAFGPHAWVRVWIGGRWVHLDAMMGYDAGHIMLTAGNGDREGFLGMVGTMGNFEVSEMTPAAATAASKPGNGNANGAHGN